MRMMITGDAMEVHFDLGLLGRVKDLHAVTNDPDVTQAQEPWHLQC